MLSEGSARKFLLSRPLPRPRPGPSTRRELTAVHIVSRVAKSPPFAWFFVWMSSVSAQVTSQDAALLAGRRSTVDLLSQ